jgi:N-acetylmuramoyl-L-alanine amidase
MTQATSMPARLRHLSRIGLGALLLALAGCASVPDHNPLALWRGSPNYDDRSARIIVLHHTQQDSVAESLRTLRTGNAGGPVSAHYLIGDDGTLYQLVTEDMRAWHAGSSRWGGLRDLNSASIGIELDNNGVEPFSAAQIASLIRLLDDLTGRLGIAPHAVVGHGDIAPTRKVDPSALFPWQQLAEAGFGLWPRHPLAAAPPGFDRWAALRLIGYDLRDPLAALRAFHRHYRGNEAEVWLPGDADILYDMQLQLMAMPASPEAAPAASAPAADAPVPQP